MTKCDIRKGEHAMAEARQTQLPKKKKEKKTEEEQASALSTEKIKKLKELDDFIEGVLEQTGEEFLEEFKQVEGE